MVTSVCDEDLRRTKPGRRAESGKTTFNQEQLHVKLVEVEGQIRNETENRKPTAKEFWHILPQNSEKIEAQGDIFTVFVHL